MEKQRIKTFGMAMITAMYGAWGILVCAVCMVYSNHTEYQLKKVYSEKMFFFMILGSLLFVAGAVLLKMCLPKAKPKYMDIGMMLVNVGLVMLILYMVKRYWFETGWDVRVITTNAFMIAGGNYENLSNDYFSQYPNNIVLTAIFAILSKYRALTGIQDSYFLLINAQAVLYGITGYLVYRVAELLLEWKWAFFAWVIYAGLIGLSPWVVIPYSDSMGLVFPILVFFLFLKFQNTGNKRWLFGTAFVCCFGGNIKPQIYIMGIAILLIFLLKLIIEGGWWGKQKSIRVVCGNTACAGLGIVLALILVWGCRMFTGFQIDDEKSFGMAHYVMMGLNEGSNGLWNQEDVEFSKSFSTKAERRTANLQVAAERLQEYDIERLWNHLKRKWLITFADGTFGWGPVGDFYVEYRYPEGSRASRLLVATHYTDGKLYPYFANAMQVLWGGTLLSGCFAIFYKNKSMEFYVLMLSIVGLCMFETCFETGARYLFTNVPVFIILAATGIKSLMDKKERKGNAHDA